ncbi:hypothetical protein H6P81_018585 [Aristolochia fimbriata]|uniref:Uncharacterized protein n=1 Tax=Aristolochia fimbriata TaxID=158543 RepID=A0AAV7E307_ARIFI|nr:hypothetical protein H6P81_018585 [Aristolochia fimbriata]
MDNVTGVVDKFKVLAKSSENFFKGLSKNVMNRNRRNPIEILKRLQREAFSDLMKLRDRQDKLERMLSFCKISKGGAFSETQMRGKIDASGAFLFLENIGEQTPNALSSVGVNTGVHSKFIFETVVREKDAVLAEFAVRQHHGTHGDAFGGPLALSKVMYLANINDWFSVSAVPIGAQCRDITMGTPSSQVHHLTDFSSFGPPLFNQLHNCGAGATIKGSNYAASFGEFISWLWTEPDNVKRSLSTLGQFSYNLLEGTKFSVIGVHHMLGPPSRQVRLGSLTVPVSSFRFHASPTVPPVETSPLSHEEGLASSSFQGSVALMVESEIDDTSTFRAWCELQKSHQSVLHWSSTLSVTPEDELGWGVSVGGVSSEHFRMEAFLRFNLGKRFSLQPGFVYAIHEDTRIPALMLRSSWSL